MSDHTLMVLPSGGVALKPPGDVISQTLSEKATRVETEATTAPLTYVDWIQVQTATPVPEGQIYKVNYVPGAGGGVEYQLAEVQAPAGAVVLLLPHGPVAAYVAKSNPMILPIPELWMPAGSRIRFSVTSPPENILLNVGWRKWLIGATP